jgi:hypothetical protein
MHPNSSATAGKSNKYVLVSTPMEGGIGYMRAMPRGDRNLLTTGRLVKIVDSKGALITEIPLKLFNAASDKPELVLNDQIVVPDTIERVQVQSLVSQMLKTTREAHVGDFYFANGPEDMKQNLEFHSAAEELGMQSFTQAIFDYYFKKVNNEVFMSARIRIIQEIDTPSCNKLYKQMAYKIAVEYIAGTLNDREGFERFLANNHRLNKAVMEVVNRKKASEDRQKYQDDKHKAYLKREATRTQRAQGQPENQRVGNTHQANESAGVVERQERRDRDAAILASMLYKKRTLGRRAVFTPEEIRKHEEVFGEYVRL